jgi:hypothetical protein
MWLAYAHPVWMIATLVVIALALRPALELRRRRRAKLRGLAELRARHLRYARPAVALAIVGFAAGLVSAVQLRGWDLLHTFHGWLALAAVVAFATAAVLGSQVERGKRAALAAHAAVALTAAGLSALTALAGLVLLP